MSTPSSETPNLSLDDELSIILTEELGYIEWRSNQLEAVQSVIEGNDVFVISPTGSGKSTIYQVPAIYFNDKHGKVTIVFTPLVSLMKDQTQKMLNRDIAVVGFHHNQHPDLFNGCWEQLRGGDNLPVLAFMTPERFSMSSWSVYMEIIKDLYDQGKIALFVIDESQCIFTWGKNFRPAFMKLENLRKDFPKVPILTLSASMRDVDITEAISILGIQGCKIFSERFDRENIRYDFKMKDELTGTVDADIIDYIKSRSPHDSGIIYCRTIKSCDYVCDVLRQAGISALPYYSNLREDKKNFAHYQWQSNKCSVIVATSSFGMGIDKADVRYVIHYEMPWDIGCFYQESGRAGRDGKRAHSIVYYKFEDSHKIKRIALEGGSKLQPAQILTINEMILACCFRTICRRWFVLGHFSPGLKEINKGMNCGHCDVCLSPTKWKIYNVYDWAVALVHLFLEVREKDKYFHIGLRNLVRLFMGSSQKRGSNAHLKPRLSYYKLAGIGKVGLRKLPNGKCCTEKQMMRIAELLIIENVFWEYNINTERRDKDNKPFTAINWYIRLGPNFEAIEESGYFPCALQVQRYF